MSHTAWRKADGVVMVDVPKTAYNNALDVLGARIPAAKTGGLDAKNTRVDSNTVIRQRLNLAAGQTAVPGEHWSMRPFTEFVYPSVAYVPKPTGLASTESYPYGIYHETATQISGIPWQKQPSAYASWASGKVSQYDRKYERQYGVDTVGRPDAHAIANQRDALTVGTQSELGGHTWRPTQSEYYEDTEAAAAVAVGTEASDSWYRSGRNSCLEEWRQDRVKIKRRTNQAATLRTTAIYGGSEEHRRGAAPPEGPSDREYVAQSSLYSGVGASMLDSSCNHVYVGHFGTTRWIGPAEKRPEVSRLPEGMFDYSHLQDRGE
jgi:hypothetical protein